MLLVYVDESGTGLKDTQTPFFVYGALTIPAERWHLMDMQLTSLKRRLFSYFKTEDFEIKGRDLRRGEKPFDHLNDDLHRLAFWRLLEELNMELARLGDNGVLMLDMRSDMHSSVDDRRLLDAYREWVVSREDRTHFVELPWFGFSAFYAGLQLVDFVAYFTDFVANETRISEEHARNADLARAYERFKHRVTFITIP